MILNLCSLSLLSAMPGILRRKLAGLLIYNIFWHGWMKLRRRYFLLYKTITSRKMLYCWFQSCLLNFYSFRFWSPKDNKQRTMQTKILGHSQIIGICSTDFKFSLFFSPRPTPPTLLWSSSHPPTPIFHHPPPTPSTTANNSVITDFFPPTAGDSANLLIKDPITMGSVWTDYNRSRNTAVLILEDSCLGASQTGPSPPLKVGMNHKAPRPPHLHRAHSVQQAGKNGWPRRRFSLYNYSHEDGRRGEGSGWPGRAGFLLTLDGSRGSTSFLIFPDSFCLFLSVCLFVCLFPLLAFPPSSHFPLLSFPALPGFCLPSLSPDSAHTLPPLSSSLFLSSNALMWSCLVPSNGRRH